LNISGNKLEALRILDDFSDPTLNKWISLSPVVGLTYANLLMKTGKNDEAIKVLSSITSAYPFHYLDYLLGVAKLNRLDKDAHLPLLKFLASFRGKNYIKAAYQHLAWYYILQDNPANYKRYMDRIKLRGSTLVDNDKQALHDAGKLDMPEPCLLKARLLFDGGYYNRAREQLVSFTHSPSFSDSRLKLEYTYRMARVCDEEGQKVQALNWYRSTLEMGRNAPEYFAANASLHMGIIYEISGKKDLALKYYNECLSLDYEDYNLSITQKAKAGINRLKK
jgi:tetratricopeptide (TPR) repeat protein